MLYSTYAIYASGKDAVLGGTIVLALTYVIYGFLAPRFAGAAAPARARGGAAAAVVAALAFVFAAGLLPESAQAQTLGAVAKSGAIKLGYRIDARPFSFQDASGKPAGYSVELCQQVAQDLKARAEWVPVKLEERFAMLRDGKVDLLCGADTETLARRKEVSFSVPVFPSGLGALLRADAPYGLVQALSERQRGSAPLWRGTPTEVLLQAQTFAVVAGTNAEKQLNERLREFRLQAKVMPVKDYAAGVQAVLERRASALFADRPILLDAMRRSEQAGNLRLLQRRFTLEPLGLAMRRGDEDFRLAVDASLARLFRSDGFRARYEGWFGAPDQEAAIFFRLSGLPE
jgi:putrescine:ornithine antiporter